MAHRIIFVVLCVSFAATPALAQDDLQEKIKHLEHQIQELKALKEQQNINAVKTEQCMKVVAREKFCTCIGNNLPRDISFEQYVHTLVSSRESLGYAGMTQEQQGVIDATLGAREKCIEKGFFK
jgi:hypothetical protein